MNQLVEVMKDALKSSTQSGSDYTAEVTRVEGNTAYVRLAGSDITDTPVAMSISAKAGDKVRVRVSDGKAWITGNDTSPPADNTEIQKAVVDNTNYVRQKISDSEGNYSMIRQEVDVISIEVGNAQTAADNAQVTADGRMKADMSNKASSITIGSGQIAFNSNTLIVNSSKFTLDANGNATFSGNLSAAGGTFSGIVTVSKTYTPPGIPAFTDTIKIGDSTRPAPLQISRNDGCLSELSAYSLNFTYNSNRTAIMTGSLYVSDGTKTTWVEPGGVTPPSDKRLKDDIEDIDSEVALRLRPVRFRFKNEEKGVRHYGFLAQEVQEVIPDAVRQNPDEYLGINYSEIIAPLCALVQEQEKRINQLEERLKALEEKTNG